MCVCVCVEPLGVVFGSNSVRWYEGQLAADAHIFLLKNTAVYITRSDLKHMLQGNIVCVCVCV